MMYFKSPVCSNVYGTSLPGVLEIVSCHNSMCEKEEHELLIFKITLTSEWDWKMSVLKNKSRTYLMSESKRCFEHYIGNYCLQTVVLASYSVCFLKQPDTLYNPFFCLGLAFNVTAINHNKIFEAQHSSLRNPTKRE